MARLQTLPGIIQVVWQRLRAGVAITALHRGTTPCSSCDITEEKRGRRRGRRGRGRKRRRKRRRRRRRYDYLDAYYSTWLTHISGGRSSALLEYISRGYDDHAFVNTHILKLHMKHAHTYSNVVYTCTLCLQLHPPSIARAGTTVTDSLVCVHACVCVCVCVYVCVCVCVLVVLPTVSAESCPTARRTVFSACPAQRQGGKEVQSQPLEQHNRDQLQHRVYMY